MTEWREVVLGDALDVLHGFAFKGEYFREEGTLIVLTPGNFFDEGGFKPKGGKEKYYDGPFPERFLLAEGDVVVAMTEQVQGLLGSSATIPVDDVYLHNQRIGLIRITDPDLLDKRFVYHLMNTSGVRSQIQATATGSKVRHTAPARIKAVRVSVPSVPLQRRLAAILDAIDRLIENNGRRVEVLEEMARAIYREWFVEFRYPCHEDFPLVETPIGPAPEGWKVTTVGEVFDVVLGGTPSRKKSEYWTGGTVPWVTSTRVNDLRVLEPSELITTEALRSCNATVMPKRTTLIVITGATLGQVSALEIEACANQSVVGVFDSDGVFSEYVYLWFKEHIGSVISHASGSAQQHINKGTVLSTRLAIPPESVVEAFGSLVRPVFDLIVDLLAGQAEMTAMRELLLPKLVTGQIDVSRLDLDELVEVASA